MPQASNEQRALMEKWFGDPVDDGGPYRFLQSHGFTEWAGTFKPPVPSHNVSCDEWECIAFLCDEWDYGFNRRPASPSTDDGGRGE